MFATKHLPWEHVLAGWCLSCLGAAKAAVTGSIGEAFERLRVLAQYARIVPLILRERSLIYREAQKVPRLHLQTMLRVGKGT